MRYGICNLSIVPIRIAPSETSEMVSQLLFGEHFKVLEKRKNWSKIRSTFDAYEGYVDNKQFEEIVEDEYIALGKSDSIVAAELIEFIIDNEGKLSTICIGATLPQYTDKKIRYNNTEFHYDGAVLSGKKDKKHIIKNAFMYLNAPYLQGGKTPFGIDCAGFTQMIYKLCGYHLLREAKQQATQGNVLSFIEESEPGDLAFFDDNEGIINHVGIIMKDNYIIHAYGKVRIDRLDHSGIYNVDTKRHTHKLRVIKSII